MHKTNEAFFSMGQLIGFETRQSLKRRDNICLNNNKIKNSYYMNKDIMHTWDNDPFFQYPKSAVSTSEGNVCLPILYLCKNLFLLAAIKADHPVYPEFIGEHAKTITPESFIQRHGYFTATG